MRQAMRQTLLSQQRQREEQKKAAAAERQKQRKEKEQLQRQQQPGSGGGEGDEEDSGSEMVSVAWWLCVQPSWDCLMCGRPLLLLTPACCMPTLAV